VTVSRMRERYAQTVLTFRITYVYVADGVGTIVGFCNTIVILINFCASVGSNFKNRIITAQNEECDNSYVRSNSKQSLIPEHSSLIFTFVT